MASGFNVGGVDLDSIFAPRSGSTPASNTGYKVSGTDLSDRYHASTGGDTIGSDTGYKSGGTDLRYIFRDINATAPTITGGTITVPAYGYNVGDSITLDVTATGSPTLTYQWYKDGTPIGGATSSSYSFTATSSTGDTGNYSVTVSNSLGSDSEDTDITVSEVVTATLTGPNNVTAGVFAGEYWEFSGSATAGLQQVRFGVLGHGAGLDGDPIWTTVSGSSYGPYQAYWGDPFGIPSISYTPGTYTLFFQAQDIYGTIATSPKTVIVH